MTVPMMWQGPLFKAAPKINTEIEDVPVTCNNPLIHTQIYL